MFVKPAAATKLRGRNNCPIILALLPNPLDLSFPRLQNGESSSYLIRYCEEFMSCEHVVNQEVGFPPSHTVIELGFFKKPQVGKMG